MTQWNSNGSTDHVEKRQKLSGGSSDYVGHHNVYVTKDTKYSLPVYEAKLEIVKELSKHKTSIIIGETGSGKTTQIPQFIYENNLNENQVIAVSQPRRVAAVSLAHRVADEMRVDLGTRVGYSVRFDYLASPTKTKILFLTDGMLLREALTDPLLTKYSFVILDEAHERSIATDVLFAVVKKAQMDRESLNVSPLKIIVMSATMDVDHFSQYFGNAPVLYIEGRQFQVNVGFAKETQSDYERSAIVSIFQAHRTEPLPGGILVFLTGAEEIESVVRQCRNLVKQLPSNVSNKIRFFPLYSALTQVSQMKVFEPVPSDTRKVIVATNIAETSITIPGVSVVIDSGKVKSRIYDPSKGIDLLKICWVSKAQACQRTGRAGRDCPGVCLRLYTQTDYDNLPANTTPEIMRCNLSTVILELLSMEIKNIFRFDFMDKPPHDAIEAAVKELTWLTAIDSSSETTDISASLRLTTLGRMMLRFPLDPKLSRVLIASLDQHCSEEMIIVLALLSLDSSVFIVPVAKKEEASGCHLKFSAPEGDLIMLLNAYRACQNAHFDQRWCSDNYISYRNMITANKIRDQLKDICTNSSLTLRSCGHNYSALRKCLCAGFFLNAAELQPDGRYLTLSARSIVAIHPSSCLFQTKPACVVFNELTLTTNTYMREITVVDKDWLLEAAPLYFKSRRIS